MCDTLVELVINSVEQASREIKRVDFWGATGENSRHNLENYLVSLIANSKQTNLIKNIPDIKEKYMSLTKENNERLKGLELAN
ncbi:hypothetical protein KKG72_00150 [bacterium]|nr:hypothetical protein [bacterium]MBU1993424.1 hypothetical protein [bacterium]